MAGPLDIDDDMLLFMDALRRGQLDLHSLVPDGARRRMQGKSVDRPVGPEVSRCAVTADRTDD
jgi:hypothetical protein